MKIAKNVNNLGTELVYDIFSKTKKLEAQGKKIIDLSLGQSAESPPEHVIEATIKALRDGNNGYTVPNGILECREAVSRKIQKLYNAKLIAEPTPEAAATHFANNLANLPGPGRYPRLAMPQPADAGDPTGLTQTPKEAAAGVINYNKPTPSDIEQEEAR